MMFLYMDRLTRQAMLNLAQVMAAMQAQPDGTLNNWVTRVFSDWQVKSSLDPLFSHPKVR